MKKAKYVILGALLATLLFSLGSPALAALTGRQVTIYPGLSIFYDDQKFTPTDANGNAVDVFAYNGTTYLPVRAISGLFNTQVQWDGATNSVYLGKHSSDKPAVWLDQLDYFDSENNSDFKTAESKTDNLGNKHSHVIYNNDRWGDATSRTYMLNGQYSKITGIFFQDYDYRSSDYVTTLKIYGDDELLYSADMTGGVAPINFSVDLTGVLQMKVHIDIEYHVNSNVPAQGRVGEVGLWT